jgi:hypothetical protein
MVDLGRLEEQLNSDPALRRRFLADPVALLRQAGIWLSPERQQALRSEAARVTRQRPFVPGTVRLRVADWQTRESIRRPS